MYKIDNKYQKAKIKNLEQRLDFQKYNIKEKKKEKRKEKENKQNNNNKKTKPQELLNNNNHHKKTVYSVCFKKQGIFFLKSNVIKIKGETENLKI